MSTVYDDAKVIQLRDAAKAIPAAAYQEMFLELTDKQRQRLADRGLHILYDRAESAAMRYGTEHTAYWQAVRAFARLQSLAE